MPYWRCEKLRLLDMWPNTFVINNTMKTTIMNIETHFALFGLIEIGITENKHVGFCLLDKYCYTTAFGFEILNQD